MPRRTLIKWIAAPLLAIAALLFIGFLAFVPSSREPGYTFVTAWGEPGRAPGQFRDPTGIAVADGEVFVADSRNGRIQVFDANGGLKRQFGTPGEAPGELGRPMNLTIHDDELYVAEYFNDRIQILTAIRNAPSARPVQVPVSSTHRAGLRLPMAAVSSLLTSTINASNTSIHTAVSSANGAQLVRSASRRDS